MLLLALFATAFAADDYRIEPCRYSLNIDIELSEPLFDGERRWQSDTCSAGVAMGFPDRTTRKDVATLRVESTDGKHVRVVVEDVARGIRLDRDGIALDTPTAFESAKKGRALSARVVVRNAEPQPWAVSADVINKPVGDVADRLEAVTGWTLRGRELLVPNRVTFQFDTIPTRSLLMLIADVGEVDVAFVGDANEAVFTRKAAPGN